MVEKADQRLMFFPILLKRLINGILPLLAFLAYSPSYAQNISLISDEETEQLLGQIASPLFKAASVPYNRNNIYIINDSSLNAFVTDGNALFVHTGTIVTAESPFELAGVIAHETGHISGGHILRQKLKNKEMQEVTLVSTLLAGAAAAAGGRGDAALAVMLGSQTSALTHYTLYRTGEERAADEAAIKLLQKTKQTPQGMLTFMKRIANQQTLNGVEEIPYFRTHPITRERITFFEKAVAENHYSDKSNLQEAFDRVKAKLFAFLNSPAATKRKYPDTDTSIPALYARAISAYKQLNIATAQKLLDDLLKKEPKNPYFHEMKGQIFMETGQIGKAADEYQKALNELPNSYLLQISLAQALLENSPSPQQANQAVTLLNKALIARQNGMSWRLLAQAYGLLGKTAEANYAAAEYSLSINALDTAKHQAEQARAAHPSQTLALKIDDLFLRLNDIEKTKSTLR